MSHPKLLLVDGYALAYRAYYALPTLRNSLGQPTGAIYGFVKTLHKWIRDHEPTHLAIAFDLGPPVRLKELPTYKAQRPPTPEDLESQTPLLKDWVRASRIPLLELHGHEADDIIAVLALQADALHWQTLIATNDKDLSQLVTGRTRILKPAGKKNEPDILLDPAGVRARFGVSPRQIPDYLALLGDASDNIPGVKGVGPKTASGLIAKFGSLDALLNKPEKIENPVLREKITSNADLLRRNLALVTLRTDLPLDSKLDELKLADPDYGRLIPFLERLGSKSLLAEAHARQQKSAQPTLL